MNTGLERTLALAMGADTFVFKPVTIEELEGALRCRGDEGREWGAPPTRQSEMVC
ncbi:MAG: hypothetical protein WD906_01670 [Anaerolineales bacterium]